jgi:S-adenosylmethionine-dependent methyltransferase
MKDRYFDGLAQRFAKNIYGSEKGKIRLHILQRDLQPFLKAGQVALDLGAGLGNMSLFLAQNQVQPTLIEPSIEMLEVARNHFHNLPATFVNSSYQDFLNQNTQKYDFILIHGLLEWLAEPHLLLSQIQTFLKPNGILSLAFYNKSALIYRNLLKGHFKKIENNDFIGVKNSLTPQNPLDLQEVLQHYQKHQILQTSGIRVFYDYMPLDFRKKTPFEEILTMEEKYSLKPEFINVARYIHLLIKNV